MSISKKTTNGEIYLIFRFLLQDLYQLSLIMASKLPKNWIVLVLGVILV